MKKKSKKFDSLSLMLNKKPQEALKSSINSNSSINPDFETKSMTTTGISCLIQKSLENLLKKENFFKSPDLTRISTKDRNLEFERISNKIRLSNKSAEYHELPFHNDEYEKFKAKYQTNIANNKGFFLYSQNPMSRKTQSQVIEKVAIENMNWDAKNEYKGLLRKRINNNGKISIIKELKEKSMIILTEALNRKCLKEDIETYKLEIQKNMTLMLEENDKILMEKYFLLRKY